MPQADGMFLYRVELPVCPASWDLSVLPDNKTSSGLRSAATYILTRGGAARQFGLAEQIKRLRVARCSHLHLGAGWSSPVARQAHNLKVAGSNPAPATNKSNISVVYTGAILRGCVFFLYMTQCLWRLFVRLSCLISVIMLECA